MATPERLEFAESTPQAVPVQEPESNQVTPWFLGSLVTVAVSACVCPACRDALAGVMLTATDCAVCGGAGSGDVGVGVAGWLLEPIGTDTHPAKNTTANSDNLRARANLCPITRKPGIDFKQRFSDRAEGHSMLALQNCRLGM